MKYCADYFSECKKLKEVDEINVIFSPKNTDILGFIENIAAPIFATPLHLPPL